VHGLNIDMQAHCSQSIEALHMTAILHVGIWCQEGALAAGVGYSAARAQIEEGSLPVLVLEYSFCAPAWSFRRTE